jgi:hypothetical protein
MLGNVKTGASPKTELETTELYSKHTKCGPKYADGPPDHHLSDFDGPSDFLLVPDHRLF